MMRLGPKEPVRTTAASDTSKLSTKKRVAVDTMRLKKDIAEDAKKLGDRARLAGQLDAKGMKPQGNAAMGRSMDDMRRITARQDSLEDARNRRQP